MMNRVPLTSWVILLYWQVSFLFHKPKLSSQALASRRERRVGKAKPCSFSLKACTHLPRVSFLVSEHRRSYRGHCLHAKAQPPPSASLAASLFSRWIVALQGPSTSCLSLACGHLCRVTSAGQPGDPALPALSLLPFSQYPSAFQTLLIKFRSNH